MIPLIKKKNVSTHETLQVCLFNLENRHILRPQWQDSSGSGSIVKERIEIKILLKKAVQNIYIFFYQPVCL